MENLFMLISEIIEERNRCIDLIESMESLIKAVSIEVSRKKSQNFGYNKKIQIGNQFYEN